MSSYQQVCRVGSAETDIAVGVGRAKLGVNGQWSLSIGKASPTVIPMTQGAAAQEVIA